MRYKFTQLILIIQLMILLVACTSALAPTQTIEVEPTTTVIPTITQTSTLTPTNTSSPTSTPEATVYEYNKSTSPNGKWSTSTVAILNENDGRVIFTIINNADNSERIVEEIEIPGPIRFPVSFDYPYVLEWSDDSSSFYYSYLFSFLDGCYAISRPGGKGLKQYELLSKNTTTVHEKPTTWMTFSTDKSQLAYTEAYGEIVFIMDIKTNMVQSFTPPPIDNLELFSPPYTKYMYWSPDGKSIIYTYVVDACADLVSRVQYYIIQIFLDSRRQTVLVTPDEHGFVPIEWPFQDKIVLKDNDDNLWWLNPNTKEIISAQP